MSQQRQSLLRAQVVVVGILIVAVSMVQVELEALFQEHCQLELVLHITFIVEAVVVPQQQVQQGQVDLVVEEMEAHMLVSYLEGVVVDTVPLRQEH
jgi:hypothetical protein